MGYQCTDCGEHFQDLHESCPLCGGSLVKRPAGPPPLKRTSPPPLPEEFRAAPKAPASLELPAHLKPKTPTVAVSGGAPKKLHLQRRDEPLDEEEYEEYEEFEDDERRYWFGLDRESLGTVFSHVGRNTLWLCLVVFCAARIFVRQSGRRGSGLEPEVIAFLVPFWTVVLIALFLLWKGRQIEAESKYR